KSDSRIGKRTNRLDGPYGRPVKRIQAVNDQKDANAKTHVRRIGPSQDRHTNWNAKGRSGHERPESAPIKGMTKLPDRIALHQESKGNDQRGGLQWGDNVAPERSGNKPKRKARQACDQRTGKRGGEKDCEIEKPIHALAPRKGEQRLNGYAI